MKTRILASATHLLASFVVISAFLLVVYVVWYPGPLSDLHVVMDAIKVVIGVDLILGPLMTLIVFDVRKSRKVLARDLSFIVFIQLSALAWGGYMTHKARSVFLVFHFDTIYSVARNDISSEKVGGDLSMPCFWQRPKQVYIPKLEAGEVAQNIRDIYAGVGRPVQYQVARYLPMEGHTKMALKYAMDMTVYTKNESNKSQLNAFLRHHGGTVEQYAFYPLEYGPYKSIVGISRENLELVGLLLPVTDN